jgi:hypothetical protein
MSNELPSGWTDVTVPSSKRTVKKPYWSIPTTLALLVSPFSSCIVTSALLQNVSLCKNLHKFFPSPVQPVFVVQIGKSIDAFLLYVEVYPFDFIEHYSEILFVRDGSQRSVVFFVDSFYEVVYADGGVLVGQIHTASCQIH